MADRKRPSLEDAETPPSKRQSLTVNGIKNHVDQDMPYRDEIERYQKDAILRQMKEYKRELNTKQTLLDDIQRRSKYHDSHIRTIDAWFMQLLDDMSLLAESAPIRCENLPVKLQSSLLTEDSEKFQEHLGKRSEKIKKAMSEILSRFPSASPEVVVLQERLSALLAAEKIHIIDMSSLELEKEQLSESLEKATIRYLSAEKKLDRAKSAQVAKIEAQAIQAARSEPNSATDDGAQMKLEPSEANPSVEDNASAAAADAARKEAVAVADKRAEHIQKLETENKKLVDDLTAMKIKLTSLSDEDYATCDLFQLMKSQQEDTIKRVNDLEARNVQLREEAQRLQAERQAFRDQIERNLETSTIEMQSQLARNDADLARIRTHRDDLIAKIAVKDATETEKKVTTHQMTELAEAQEIRISALESENERLRLRLGETTVSEQDREDLKSLDIDALRSKVQTIEKEYALLSNELPSMAEAYKKVQAVANKKVADVAELEEKAMRLTAEKAKADQKYFGAMRAKESRESEIRILRTQNSKSSEIVSQLKDAESSCRQLLVGLEKQLAETKDIVTNLSNQQHTAKQSLAEEKISTAQLSTQVLELKKSLMNKDAAIHVATHSHREAEIQLVELKAQHDQVQKEVETLKKKASGEVIDESVDMLRALVICTICRKNFKNTCIKTCGHIFCQECVEERFQNRARKCPNCGKAFGKGDYMRVTL